MSSRCDTCMQRSRAAAAARSAQHPLDTAETSNNGHALFVVSALTVHAPSMSVQLITFLSVASASALSSISLFRNYDCLVLGDDGWLPVAFVSNLPFEYSTLSSVLATKTSRHVLAAKLLCSKPPTDFVSSQSIDLC